MAVAFSTDGTLAIEKVLTSINSNAFTELDIEITFRLNECLTWIEKHSVGTVALQIPDELQSYAFRITKWLESKSTCKFFVLADTSYGSCCIDEVSAEHCKAEAIIHFGHSCLSPTKRLPSLLVFNQMPLDVEDCANKCKAIITDTQQHLLLLYDVAYYHIIEDLYSDLSAIYPNIKASCLHIAENCLVASAHQSFIHHANAPLQDHTTAISQAPDTEDYACSEINHIQCCNRCVDINKKDLDKYSILYIGPESMTLSNALLLWNQCKFYSYNPSTQTCREEGLHSNKALMKRFYLVEKAKDAQIIGIVAGTLGVANYLEVINRLKALLKKSGKKHYTFVIGKLNVAKLANFMEIDIYVLVACHENSLLNNAEFYRPVITPYELELACNPQRLWDGGIVTDFQQLLPGGQDHVPLPEGDLEEQVDVSLVTGNLRKLGINKEDGAGVSSALVTRNENTQVVAAPAKNAGDYLSQRSWQGLEPQLGRTDVKKAVDGRKGIAIAYEEEPPVKQS